MLLFRQAKIFTRMGNNALQCKRRNTPKTMSDQRIRERRRGREVLCFQMNEVHELATWLGGMLQTGPTGSVSPKSMCVCTRERER